MADLADRFYRRLLVIRCQVGDPAAFTELVGLCQPKLRAFLHKMLGGPQHVDDLAQEVWIDVHRELPRLADPAAFLAWFYQIARNRVYRLLRRKPLATEPITGDLPQAVADDGPDFTAEDAQAVHAALDRLSPEHREVLLLRFMEEMTYEEVAVVAGCQPGTVKSRIFNAKRALRAVLENQETP